MDKDKKMSAEEFVKNKGLKDTLFDVEHSTPNYDLWIQGGLSKLLKEYASSIPVKDGYSRDDMWKAFREGIDAMADKKFHNTPIDHFDTWLSQHSPSPIEKKKDYLDASIDKID